MRTGIYFERKIQRTETQQTGNNKKADNQKQQITPPGIIGYGLGSIQNNDGKC